MKQLSKILIIIFIASTFNIAEAAEFSDEFAKNLLTCTEYGENYSSIQGYEKNKCVKITLPCEVGSSVYAIIERKLYQCRVESYIIDSGNTSTVYLSYKQNINGKEEKKYYYLYIFKFGKTWFTDYNEAQHAFHLSKSRG